MQYLLVAHQVTSDVRSDGLRRRCVRSVPTVQHIILADDDGGPGISGKMSYQSLANTECSFQTAGTYKLQ